jgi:DNA-binding NarL/FixJ family response regulator
MKKPNSKLKSKNVFVVGKNALQNELLANALTEKTGLPCFAVEDLTGIKTVLENSENGSCLALYDCLGKDWKACLADLKQIEVDEDFMLGFFNVRKGEGLEKGALPCGVKGFFYIGEPFDLFVRGVAGIFTGELWFSRQLLSELVSQVVAPSRSTQKQLISEHEKEIFKLLATGATNKEIAKKMHLSPRKLKSQIEKVFKKINVRSKPEAAVWAASNLEI